MRKIAICDDQAVMRRQLSGYLEQLQQEWDEELVSFYYSSGEEVLEAMPRDTSLLLLDIAMTGINGVECARQLRSRGEQLPIVFITSMTEYAMQGYAVHAFGFLEKPVTYADFARVVREALAPRPQAKPQVLLVNTAEGTEAIDPARLLYAEVYQHQTSFVLAERTFKANVQLAQVEKQLRGAGFFRCHKSYLVNLQQVEFIGQDHLRMKNGAEIALSKYRRREFLAAYGECMGVLMG